MNSKLEEWIKRVEQTKPAQTTPAANYGKAAGFVERAEQAVQQTVQQRKNDYARNVMASHDRMANTMYGSANRASNNLMDMATRAKLMQTANEMADIKTRQAKALENPRASTAYTRQTEKQPMQDRAQRVAEIRKDVSTTPEQSRLGKGVQSVMLSPYASIEYLGESGKQAIKNQKAYEESDLDTKLAEAYTYLMQTERAFGYGSPEYEAAQANYDAVQRELNAFKNAPDKAVDMDSRAAQFMGGVQKLQEEALEGTTGAGRFLGEAALSIGSNLSKLPLNAVVPGASLALMGAEAAAGKAYELGQQGVNAGQALTRGLVSGGIEALTEKVPLDNLVDIIKTGGKVGLMNILKQAVTEAGEEGVAYLLNLGADKVAGDPESEFVWNDFWKSVGMGALSGGIMGGGATAINRANAASVGKNYQDVAPELVAEGLQMKQDTDAYRTAAEMQRKLDAGKTLSNVDVGRVVQDNESAAAPLKQAAMEMAEAEVKQRTAERTAAVSKSLGYGKEGARVFGEIYNGGEVDAKTLLAVFDTPYQAGLTGGDGKRFTDPMQIAAYSAGNSDRIAQQGIDAKAKPGKVFSKAESGFDYTNAPADLTQQQKNFGNLMAKAFGVKGSFDKDGGANYNAYYDSDTGAVAFAKDFGIDPALMNKLGSMDFQQKVERLSNQREQSFTFYVAHEIANHVAANRAPAEMRAFNNAMYRYLQDTEGGNQARERMAFYRKNKVELDTQGAIEEIGADSILMLYYGDEQKFMAAMDRVLNGKDEQAKKGARTWGEALKNAIAKLKAWAKKLTGRQNAEAKAEVEKGISELEKLRDMFETAVAKAAQNTEQARQTGATKAAAKVETAGNGTDIRHSIKSYAKAAGLEVSRDADGRVAFAIDGKPVTKVTPEHIRKNSGLGGLITVAQVNGNISAADATEQYKAVADIMNMIINTQDPEMVWAWVGSSLFSAVKSNADGQYGTTIDFTTVCRKTQDMITAMSRAMVKMKRGLTKDEVTQLQSKLIAEGSSVPCPVCYVFSRWAGIGSVLDNMYKWQQKYEGMSKTQINARIEELTDKLGKGKSKQLMEMLKAEDEEYDSVMQEREKLTAEKKQLNGKKRTAVKDNDAYTLSNINNRIAEIDKRMGQLNKRRNEIKASVAPELAWLLNVRSQPDYEQHGKVKPDVLFNLDDAATFSESYPLAWKYRTSRGPSAGKAILPYSDMRLGDMILGVDKTSADGNTLFSEVNGQFTEEQLEAVEKAVKRVKAQNLIGGQRFQSTSDFRYDYALDYLMAFFEAQALGSKLQTYTKIVEFADMVAAVRGDVNLSVMPKNKGYITTNTGVDRLSFSSVTGVDFEAAKRASEMHDNAQLILVGINDQHILAALEDSEETLGKYIGFVIPYHASGASINDFIRVLVNNLGENYQAKSYQDYSDVQTDSVRKNATAAQLRRAELRNKLLRGKDGGKNWEPDADDLKFIRGKSVDISDRSFAELREVELKALRGDKAAIAEYESWTAGALWNLYTKLWTEDGAEYGVRLNTAQAKSVMPHEYWNKTVSRDKAYINGFLFRSYCYNLGLTPRFSGATVKGEKHGDFTGSKGYWKTLIDRPMYNNDGTYRDQQIVNVTDFQKEMLTPAYAAEKWAGYAVQEPNATRAARAADKFMGEKQFSLKGEQQMAKELKRIRTEGAKAGKSAEEIRAEVAKIVDLEYAELLKTYGAIERGETPFRDIQVPERTGKDRKVSQTVRTILEAGATPDAMIPDVEALVAEGALSFESYTDDQAIADATAKLQTRGWSNTLSKWISDVDKGVVTKENTVIGWALYNNAANKGDVETALTILQKMVGHQRNAAQALQATRVLKKLSPDAQLYGVQRSVQDLQDELNKKYGDDKAPQLKIDPELGEKFMQAETDAERDEVMGEIYRDVGKQMPSTFRDKWNAWRYLAMLGNARTHVRNIVGNAGFAPVVGIKNITATGIEALVSGVSGGKIGRTKSITADKAMLKAAWKDYANVADEISNGGKYSDFQNANRQIEAGRVIFKNKTLEKARTLNSAAMEAEDAWFSKPHYAAALASYCKANGITAQQIAKGGKAMDKARAYAIKEAQKATYRDTNALSQAFGEIGGKWRTSSNPVKKGVGIAIEGILPFRKTPANILARGVEYSPIGLMNGIKKAVWDVQKGNATATEAIDNISAGLTGSMLMALGAFLAAQGLIRGGGEGDDKEKEFAELQGHQTYAMELPNGKSVTLDWLAPEALPFFIGVNFFESTQGKKEEMDINSIIGSVTSITEPLLEMSCLQGLNDLIDSVGYASGRDVNSLVAMAASAATSYLTQALPTLGGQLERSFQKERMTTYSDKNKRWIPTDLQYTIGKATAKIPGLDYQQVPYIDAWGRTESTGNFAENAFGNLLNPSYTSQIDTAAMEDELLRLYRSTGESVFPSRAARYFMVNNERKDLTAEEYVQYATLKGRYSYELLTELVDSSTYKSLTDAEKAKMVREVFDNANKQAKAAISEYELDEWAAKYAEAEKKYGIKQEVFAEVRMNTRFLSSLKDKNGETITNSLSLLKMEAVYNIPGLTDKQRQALFDYLDVGKSVRHYNKSLVKQKLAAMRKNAK